MRESLCRRFVFSHTVMIQGTRMKRGVISIILFAYGHKIELRGDECIGTARGEPATLYLHVYEPSVHCTALLQDCHTSTHILLIVTFVQLSELGYDSTMTNHEGQLRRWRLHY